MIEILYKNNTQEKVNSISDLPSNLDFLILQFIDYSESDLEWLKNKYGLDFSIMKQFEDIEISSHFYENENQVSFHFSIPYFNDDMKMIEDPVFIIFTTDGVFLFSTAGLDHFFNNHYSNKSSKIRSINDTLSVYIYQFEFIADYFADITEYLASKIKVLSNRVLIEKNFTKDDMDVITQYNFSNILIKESLIEASRVYRMYMRSNWEQKIGLKKFVLSELNDMLAISDYIQFNLERLDDLKENITNKIDIEQNYIFKMLTVVTVCISLPTLIAGIYGMNFEHMPILKTMYGYPLTLLAMVLAAVLPFLYFKRNNWLKR